MPNAKRLTRLIVDKSAVLADPEGEGEAVRLGIVEGPDCWRVVYRRGAGAVKVGLQAWILIMDY